MFNSYFMRFLNFINNTYIKFDVFFFNARPDEACFNDLILIFLAALTSSILFLRCNYEIVFMLCQKATCVWTSKPRGTKPLKTARQNMPCLDASLHIIFFSICTDL